MTLNPHPPELDPLLYGWKRDTVSKSLVPVLLDDNVALAPPDILQMIRCGCSSERPCSTAQCRCAAAKLPCTLFCKCGGESVCNNEKTRVIETAEENESDIDQ